MRSFLYYLPGAAGGGSGNLAALGLADRLAGPGLSTRGVLGGPDGGNGSIVGIVAVGRETEVGYFPDRQTWVKPAGKDYWLGWEEASPPTPGDLARPSQLPGHPVTLADGQEWVVPIARLLPRALGLAADGSEVQETLPRYRHLCATTDRFWEWHREMWAARAAEARGEAPEPYRSPTEDELWQAASEALGVNYRVSRVELAALRVLTVPNAVAIIWALLDGPAIEEAAREAQKKGVQERSAGPATSSGGQASSPATSPPSASANSPSGS
jgi:hypothetical protein